MSPSFSLLSLLEALEFTINTFPDGTTKDSFRQRFVDVSENITFVIHNVETLYHEVEDAQRKLNKTV